MQSSGGVKEPEIKKQKKTSTKELIPWIPTTWPEEPQIAIIKEIFDTTIFLEIDNILKDIENSSHEGLNHRGHILSIVLLCAVDTISSYASREENVEFCTSCHRSDRVGPRYKKFIKEFFPDNYARYSEDIYKLFRNNVVHSWNLFEATILPENQIISKNGNIISFGLLNFYEALKQAYSKFLEKLKTDEELRKISFARYKELKSTAR